MTPSQRRDAITELEECHRAYAFDDTHLKQSVRETHDSTAFETSAMRTARLAVATAHRQLHDARQAYAAAIKAGIRQLTDGA